MRTWKPLSIVAAFAGALLLAGERNTDIQPAVQTGADAFQTIPVSSIAGWVQAGIYDSKEGLEVVVMEYGKITFLDPKTFAEKRTVPVSDDRVGSKQLISLRADGKLNLMSPGGGYSDVGLSDMNGNELWKFRPSANLPPNKMVADDLDRDGTKEFYAADNTGVYRLDPAGKVVWHAKVRGNNYLFILPPEGSRPACVVTEEGVWDCDGKELQRGIKGPSGNYRLHGVRWGNSHHLVSGQNSTEGGNFFVFDLAGKTLFQQANGGWGAVEFFSVRFKAGEPPSLVVIGAKHGASDLMGMSIFAHDGTLLYREVCPNKSFTVVPDDAKGEDALLIVSGGIKKFVKH